MTDDARIKKGEKLFQPNVRIQLVTTSDGKKLGGIRMSTLRPKVHAPKQADWGEACNKIMTGRPGAFCRRACCLVDGYNQVDKLEKSIELHQRQIAN